MVLQCDKSIHGCRGYLRVCKAAQQIELYYVEQLLPMLGDLWGICEGFGGEILGIESRFREGV